MEDQPIQDHEGADRRPPGLLPPLALLWLAGVMLRLTILALPPALPSIGGEFHLRGFDIGVLTAIPPLFFALAAVPGALLIGRFGAANSLVVGLIVNALGAGARGFAGDVAGLEVTTSVMCIGGAVMQPALPTLVRTWTPGRVGLATATYTCGLLCGEVLPMLWPFTPDLPWVGGGWRSGLFQGSLPVLATAIMALFLQPRDRRERTSMTAPVWPDWRRGSIWKVGLLLGAVNASYFGLNGFLPGWLSHSGDPGAVKSTLLALNAAQIPASLLLIPLLERFVFQRWSYVVAGLLVLAGGVGLATAPAGLTTILAILVGFCLAWLLTLALALPPLLVAEEDVPSVSAAVFTVSYTVAVLTALATGLLESRAAGGFTTVLPIAAAAATVAAVGLTVRRPASRTGTTVSE